MNRLFPKRCHAAISFHERLRSSALHLIGKFTFIVQKVDERTLRYCQRLTPFIMPANQIIKGATNNHWIASFITGFCRGCGEKLKKQMMRAKKNSFFPSLHKHFFAQALFPLANSIIYRAKRKKNSHFRRFVGSTVRGDLRPVKKKSCCSI